jgi:hypothetical protein
MARCRSRQRVHRPLRSDCRADGSLGPLSFRGQRRCCTCSLPTLTLWPGMLHHPLGLASLLRTIALHAGKLEGDVLRRPFVALLAQRGAVSRRCPPASPWLPWRAAPRTPASSPTTRSTRSWGSRDRNIRPPASAAAHRRTLAHGQSAVRRARTHLRLRRGPFILRRRLLRIAGGPAGGLLARVCAKHEPTAEHSAGSAAAAALRCAARGPSRARGRPACRWPRRAWRSPRPRWRSPSTGRPARARAHAPRGGGRAAVAAPPARTPWAPRATRGRPGLRTQWAVASRLPAGRRVRASCCTDGAFSAVRRAGGRAGGEHAARPRGRMAKCGGARTVRRIATSEQAGSAVQRARSHSTRTRTTETWGRVPQIASPRDGGPPARVLCGGPGGRQGRRQALRRRERESPLAAPARAVRIARAASGGPLGQLPEAA